MGKKVSLVAAFLALVCLSGASYADSLIGFSKVNFAVGSITVVSEQETSIPGYVHEKYVYAAPDCLRDVQVDHYGPAIDPSDVQLLKLEHAVCMEIHDGGGPDSSDSAN